MALESSKQNLRDSITFMFHDTYSRSPFESGLQSAMANYYKISIKEFEEYIKTIAQEDKLICLTFDDGGSSFYTQIVQVLNRYGLQGHFFCPTDYIGQPHFLTELQIADLYSQGHIIGSHSTSHPQNMSQLSKEERRAEWKQSVEILRKIINDDITEISIPNGYNTIEDIDVFQSLGIQKVFTSNPLDCFEINKVSFFGRYSIDQTSNIKQVRRLIRFPLFRKLLHIKYKVKEMFKSLLGNKYLVIKRILRKLQ